MNGKDDAGVYRAADLVQSTVFVAGRETSGGRERAIHTRPDCPILATASSVFKKDVSMYPDDKPVCKSCTGNIDRPETHDRSHHNALKAAAEGGK